MRRVRRLKTGGVVVGRMAKGCRLCILGAKMVLFITGLCDLNCYYCPISYKRRGKDLIYADEVLVEKDEDIIREAKLIRALGTGITGGEPLMVPERVLYYINLLKEVFGKKHHIHLYTYGRNLDESLMGKLAEAGLDEIRFHLVRDKDREKVRLAVNYGVSTGVEMPAIPGSEKRLIEIASFLEKVGGAFLNLNEMEITESNMYELYKRGFKLKRGGIVEVEGSEETALKVIEWAAKNLERVSVYYCPALLKDNVQMRNRWKRRARSVAKPYEYVTERGTLLKGVICGENITLSKLKEVKEILTNEFNLPSELIYIDNSKLRLETRVDVVDELKGFLKKKGLKVALVEESPTDGRLELTFIPL